MIGVTITDDGSLRRMDQRIQRLAQLDLEELLEGIGAEAETQTRRRIQEEKRGPDGVEWPDWSENYAKSKHGQRGHEPHPGELRSSGGHTLLQLDGGLLDSIQYEVFASEVRVGSNLVYAAPNQAQRPFLGLSPENEGDIEQLVKDFLEEVLQ